VRQKTNRFEEQRL
jgi:hypothetical protein